MLNPRPFGLAMGAVYALWMAFFAWVAAPLRFGEELVSFYAKLFPGYRPTFLGGLVGAAYGFLMGYLFGWATAGLYNAAQERRPVGVTTATRP